MSKHLKGTFACDYAADTDIMPDILAQINTLRTEQGLDAVDVITAITINFDPTDSVVAILDSDSRPTLLFNDKESIKLTNGDLLMFGAKIKGNITKIIINMSGLLEAEYTYLDFNG